MNMLRYLYRHNPRIISLSNQILTQQLKTRTLTVVLGFSSKTEIFETPDPVINPNTRKDSRNEKLFLLAQNDPDRFGNQQTPGIPVTNSQSQNDEDVDDAGDRAEEDYLKNPPHRSQRLSTKQYADMIKEHFRNKRIKEAIDVLEVRMLKEDRVKPENYIYNLLIGECARMGYTKKAFGLFTRMKQRGLKVTGGTYTALFNACSTTPWLQDGLNKANRLRQLMLEKGHEPNASNYNAMIKAFGRAGDIATAFSLVDEMQAKRISVDVQTYNFILQACISDTELGFRHALLVWHKMLRRRIVPDVFSFNLMLRCVRDCGLGDLETTQEVIQQILVTSRTPISVSAVPKLEANLDEKLLVISSNNQTETEQGSSDTIQNNQQLTATNDSQLEKTTTETPNLIAKLPHLGTLMALSEVKNPEDRLLLIGGTTGFLNEMKIANTKPDIKTFTQLLEVQPSTYAAEKKLLSQLKRMEIKCDIDFFNALIKKRCLRSEYDGAKEVLGLIKTADLKPDIVTYGVLAMACETPDDADELIQEMYNKGVRMNIQILGAMLRKGCVSHDFRYVIKIMDIVKTELIKPNEQFLRHLDKFSKHCAFVKRTEPNAKFRKDFTRFQQELIDWKEFMGLANAKVDEAVELVRDHPWEQFRYDQPSGMEPLKNPKLRHQKKLTRHIQRIKIDRLREDGSSGALTSGEDFDAKRIV